jgi:hypothetical protein
VVDALGVLEEDVYVVEKRLGKLAVVEVRLDLLVIRFAVQLEKR